MRTHFILVSFWLRRLAAGNAKLRDLAAASFGSYGLGVGIAWLRSLAVEAAAGLRGSAAEGTWLRGLTAAAAWLRGLTAGALWLRCVVPVILLACVSAGCHSSNPDTPHVLIETQAGDIEVELYPKQAPKTAGAFLSYIDSGFYKSGSFYRVLNEDNQVTGAAISKLIQGGIWKTNHAKAAGLPGVPHETTQQTHILHKDGTISLARSEPGSATTEFFICVGDQPGFDYGGENNPDGQGYAAFGKVVKGMDVVRTLYARPENNQSFTPSIPIFNIVRK